VGYDDGCLLNKVKDYPYSVILLDEIEKASLKVQNIFQQILEEGFIRNGKNEIIYFNNATIIMTSNLCTTSSIGFNQEETNDIKILPDEFFSRINRVIEFSKLDKLSAKKYIKREANNLKLSKEEIDKLILKSNLQNYGIRGLQKELNKYKIHKLLSKV